MAEEFDTYYTRTAVAAPRPPLAETVEADVCIIGGGLAGLATAMSLAERGKKAVVLEGRRIGFGASGRNGGFVLAGYAAGMHGLVAKVGMEHARKLFDLTRAAQQLIRGRIAGYNIDCNPVDGHLRASWHDAPDYMKGHADYLRKNFDLPVEVWDTDKVRDVCRTGRYYQGEFFPDYFAMHPLNYILGLVREIEARGGKIFEDSMAVDVEEERAGFNVRTARGMVKAKDIVFCGSAYFNGLEKRLSNSCLPVSTYVMVTEPLPQDRIDAAIRAPYCIRDTRWADDYYRLLPGNRILWGGRVGLGRLAPANLDNLMMGDMLKIYPQLEGARVEKSWAGVMGYTVHKMPHIGLLRPGVWMCTNFGGNGLGPTTAGGEVIASAIAEGDMRHKLFEPFGFAWTGGALGPLVAQGVYWSWELADRLGDFKAVLKRRA